MQYRMEPYKSRERFNEQYQSIYEFLLRAGELPCNEHFHWGRFEWMHAHACLDESALTGIALFKDEAGQLVGLLTYDTDYADRNYLLHTTADEALLAKMLDTVLEREGERAIVRVNARDEVLCALLRRRGFVQTGKACTVLALDLRRDLEYTVPAGYAVSAQDFRADPWQHQMVIHRGFDNPGVPAPWAAELLARIPHQNKALQTFAFVPDAADRYCAHCGVWYAAGDTAYVEPVATLPEHRRRGLAKAVVYEACRRAGALGAKRAVVLSDQAFYLRLGFAPSSEVYCWERPTGEA